MSITLTTTETAFFSENVYEHFVSKSLWAEVHGTGVSFIVETIHEPCGNKCQPPDDDHQADMVLSELMGEAVDINHSHIGSHIFQSRYRQPASKECCFV